MNFKRWMSLILAMTMVLSFVPQSVIAEAISRDRAADTSDTSGTGAQLLADPEVGSLASGTCGDSLYWSLDEFGYMTIYGEGDMYDYSPEESDADSLLVPWDSYRNLILSVVIEEDVSSVGDYAFAGCTNLTTLSMSESLKRIGDCAFESCFALAGTLTIPAAVTEIGESAFVNCTSLTGLVFNEGLETIGMMAFFACTGLTGPLDLPASLLQIGQSAFRECSGLTGTLLIPNSVTSIGEYAFAGCYNLTALVLSENLTEISGYAFGSCSGLTGGLVIPNSVTSIGEYAFDSCEGLTSLVLSENLTTIEKNAFYWCSGLTGTLLIPDKVVTIHDGAFQECAALTGITFGKALRSIGTPVASNAGLMYGPFDGCFAVTEITFRGSAAPVFYCSGAFTGSEALTLYLPENMSESDQNIIQSQMPENVTVIYLSTGVEDAPVSGLTAGQVYSSTVVLSWDAFDIADATGYQVLRDGELIATVIGCGYTDTGLTPGSSYRYSVRAVTADALSAAGELTVTTAAPQILSVTTESGSEYISPDMSTLTIRVADTGNLAALGEARTKLEVRFTTNGLDALLGESITTAGVTEYAIRADLSIFPEGPLELTILMTDVDGAADTETIQVTLDAEPPAKLSQVVAVSDELSIYVNWTMATEIDSVGYRVYRKTSTDPEFTLLAQIDGRNTQAYQDQDVEADLIYQYYVVAVDQVGREGEPSDIAGATLADDTSAPMVTKLNPSGGSYLTGTEYVSMAAQDNVAVTRTEIWYSTDSGANWKLLAEAENAMARGYLDTTALADGILQLKAIAADQAGNESDPMIQEYTIDNTGPGMVTGLEYTATSVSISLTWDDVADNDIGSFTLEQKLEDGSYQVIQSGLTTLGANITGLAPDIEFTYRVVGYDIFGNRGTPSGDFTVFTASDTTAPVVTRISPSSGRYSSSISLSATAEDDYAVTSMTLQVSTDQVNWTDVATQRFRGAQAVCSISAELDLTPYEDGFIYVRAIASDGGNRQSSGTYTVEHMVDKTAPDAPSSVTAVGGNGYIEISWTQETTDTAAYSLYRAESEDGEYTLLAGSISSLNYFDRSAELAVTYYYKLAATDTAGNTGSMSAAVSAQVQPDTQAPEIVSIYPAAGTLIGPGNSCASALVTDNLKLATVLVEYGTDGQAYQVLTELIDVGSYNAQAAGYLPLEEFSHGDTLFIRVTAVDALGNRCNSMIRSYTLDLQAPSVTDVTAEFAEDHVQLTWTGGMEEDLAGYRIYRKTESSDYTLIHQMYGTAGQSNYAYADSDLSTGGETYTYRVEAVDVRSNCSSAESSGADTPAVEVPEIVIGPTAVISCEQVLTVGVEYIIDASLSTDDSAVAAYAFDFGDGTTSTNRSPVHTYTETGEYTITLTVTDDDGNQDTISRVVLVKESGLLGVSEIRIVDENGAAVPNAPVYFDLGEETQVIRLTDKNGYARFTSEAGRHTVGCVIANNEWLPVKKDVIVNAGQTTSVSMTLIHRPIIEGEFEIRRMTFEEIVAAGIDITQPENQYYVQIDLHLTYENQSIDTSIPYNPFSGIGINPIVVKGSGGGSGEDDDDNFGSGEGDPIDWRKLFPAVVQYEFSQEVAIALLDIPMGASSLKEFFDVRLHVINNASSEFSMLDNVITLNVPEGLTLMETDTADSQTVTIPEIQGQTTETVNWILRGDEIGEYYLDASYNGTLSLFNEQISAVFQAEDPIEVYGMSNLKVILEVAEELDKGTLYYNALLLNEGRVDIYRPRFTVNTSDILLEMGLYDATGVQNLDNFESDARTRLSALPNVLEAGGALRLHYISIDQTEYTEGRMTLEKYVLEFENTYGLTVEVVEKPLSFFTGILNANVNAMEKAALTLTDNRSAYEKLTDDDSYIYWSIYAATEGKLHNALRSEFHEQSWALFKGDLEGLLNRENKKQIRALLVKMLEMNVEANDEAEYTVALAFLKGLVDFLKKTHITDIWGEAGDNDLLLQTLIKVIDDLCRREILLEYIGGNRTAGSKALEKKIIEEWAATLNDEGVYATVSELSFKLRQIFSSKLFKTTWEAIGIAGDFAEDVMKAMESTSADLGVFLAAQSDLNTYLFYIDTLMAEIEPRMDALSPKFGKLWKEFVEDTLTGENQEIITDPTKYWSEFLTLLVKAQIETIPNAEFQELAELHSALASMRALMTQGELDVQKQFRKNILEENFWTGLNFAYEKVLDKAGLSAGALGVGVLIIWKLSEYVGDEILNYPAQHEASSNIRYLGTFTELTRDILDGKRSAYLESQTEDTARDYMMMIKFLLSLRTVGESQAAQLGVSYETYPGAFNTRDLFMAVWNLAGCSMDHNTWYKWRDFAIDKISRLRAQLLKNPVTVDVNTLTAPIVTFNFAEGRTNQSFSADYEYSLDGGKNWTTCTGGPIEVALQKYAQELQVRWVDASAASDKVTAFVTINAPVSLQNSGIRVVKTGTGYRAEQLDSDRTYEITFSETELDYAYGYSLQTTVEAGSTAYTLETDVEYPYIYIRTLANADYYASYATPMAAAPMVELSLTAEGSGQVSGAGTYEYGRQITLIAVPEEGYGFDGWYDADVLLSTEAEWTTELYTDCAFTGRFSVRTPRVTAEKATLTLEDEVSINIYFTVENMTADLEDMGLLAWDEAPAAPSYDNADHRFGGVSQEGERFKVSTDPIAAKDMGQTRYYMTYAKKADGTFVYSQLFTYSPLQYAENMLSKVEEGTTPGLGDLEALCVALLNYGAEAQKYFAITTDYAYTELMNAGLTGTQKAYVSDYSEDMVTPVVPADASKAGSFTATENSFISKKATVTLGGALAVNFYLTPSNAADSMTLYYWSAADYEAVTELTAENATGAFDMERTSGGRYLASVENISAKNMADTVYVCGVYEAGGVIHSTGIIAYSIGKYCTNKASFASDVQALAMATAVYGCYAKEYFKNLASST